MSAIPVGAAASSWMQRARAGDLLRRNQDRDHGCAVTQPRLGPNPGWDPADVWLSRIERPRRLRTNCPTA
jgi:hypothetical protein